MIRGGGHLHDHVRNPSGSAPTNEMNSVVEQNDTSHEIVDDVLD